MRIKPYIILGLATFCAGAGLATIMTTSDPYTTEPGIVILFWLSLSLAVWALFATFFSLAGQRLALALASGLVWAIGAVSLLLTSHWSIAGKRLSSGVILVTIVVTIGIWIYSRKSSKQP